MIGPVFMLAPTAPGENRESGAVRNRVLSGGASLIRERCRGTVSLCLMPAYLRPRQLLNSRVDARILRGNGGRGSAPPSMKSLPEGGSESHHGAVLDDDLARGAGQREKPDHGLHHTRQAHSASTGDRARRERWRSSLLSASFRF